MIKSEGAGNKFECLNEKDARLEIVKIGRSICGVCESYLIQPINLITMKKQFVIALLAVFTISVNAQEKKSKAYKQHRSTEASRYVTK